MIPIGPYMPDQADYMAAHTASLANVLPLANGYGPFPSFNIQTSALAAQCRGFFVAINADGSPTVFAGTSTKLYKLSNSDFTWTDVSKAAGTYSAVPTADQWQMRQFNNFVIAVQINTAPQVFDLTSSTEFADLGGSPPQARYIEIVGRFIVLSGLGSSTPYRVQWCGQNATTTWTSGTSQSDFQDLPDGGQVKGVAGGEYGIVVQAAALRRMHYVGPPLIFTFDRISDDVGAIGPLSMVRGGDRLFFYSSKGFIMMTPTGQPVTTGLERVDRTFKRDLDTGALQYFVGASDPRSSRVHWAYRSSGSSVTGFDRIITYDWGLDRWGPSIVTSGEYLASLVQPGITLENLDSVSSSIDALGISLDDISTASLPLIGAANTDHKIGLYSGTPIEATLKTAEQGIEGRRIFVRGFRPITDASSVYGAIEHRANAQAASATTAEQAINGTGLCPARIETRLARAKMRIPAGTTWTYCNGAEPDFVPTGQR